MSQVKQQQKIKHLGLTALILKAYLVQVNSNYRKLIKQTHIYLVTESRTSVKTTVCVCVFEYVPHLRLPLPVAL